jgi:hypothetical protein
MSYNIDTVGFPNIPLTDGMMLKLEARSTTSDAAVSGVTCSLWAIYGDSLTAVDPFQPDTIPAYTVEKA